MNRLAVTYFNYFKNLDTPRYTEGYLEDCRVMDGLQELYGNEKLIAIFKEKKNLLIDEPDFLIDFLKKKRKEEKVSKDRFWWWIDEL